MRIIRLDRDGFVAKVQENRDNHRAVFERALEGYRDRWIQELESRLQDVRRGREISQYFSLPEPEDHTDDYDRILCGSPRIVEGFSMRLPERGPQRSRS